MANPYGPPPPEGTVWYDGEWGNCYIVVGDVTLEQAVGYLWEEYFEGRRPGPYDDVAAVLSSAERVPMFRVLASQSDLAEPGWWHTDGHGARLIATMFPAHVVHAAVPSMEASI